jgi:hypothetical protein
MESHASLLDSCKLAKHFNGIGKFPSENVEVFLSFVISMYLPTGQLFIIGQGFLNCCTCIYSRNGGGGEEG